MQTWIGTNIAFWLIAAMIIVSAGFAAYSRSIVQAAYNLFFTLFGMAGLYVLLGSAFLAITQVIIYVGGILVLLMFGVLLTNRPLSQEDKSLAGRYLVASAVGAGVLGFVAFPLISGLIWPKAAELGEPAESVRALGDSLLGAYLPGLEVAGMTLLFCLIGAAWLVRRTEH